MTGNGRFGYSGDSPLCVALDEQQLGTSVDGVRSMVMVEVLSAGDREEIEKQVKRILDHPLFHQSKRLPMFLRHIVKDSLTNNNAGASKERTLGVEVFGRKPDYDNNSDPIVRVTATELRKKLAQYYYEDGHSDEIRIELPPGSYLPRFRRSVAQTAQEITAVVASTLEEPSVLPSLAVETKEPTIANVETPVSTSSRSSVLSWPAVTVGLLVLLGLSFMLWRHSHPPLSRFWAQIARSPNPVLVIMPVIGSDDIRLATGYQRNVSVRASLSLEDTSLAVRIVSQLEKHEARYQLISSSDVTLDQLRSSPAVLIGALDNIWTMRLSQELPFVFKEDEGNKTGRIIDRTSGSTRDWSVDINTSHSHIDRDYGIVARYRDRLTGEPTVVVAGISSQGTQAAGELLTSPEFESIPAAALRAENFEVIVATQAIDGHAGPPQIVAYKTW